MLRGTSLKEDVMHTDKAVVTLRSASARRRFLRSLSAVVAAWLLPGGKSIAARYERSSTGSETPAGDQFAPGDVRSYGIVANVSAAASANTAALAALVSPAGTFSGQLFFPNTTGSDVYYFNDLIAFHDGIHLDLRGSTLSFTKTGVKRDSASGFIHAVRDFVIENGTLVTSYVVTSGYNTGNVLAFGGRGDDTAFFPNLYDSLLSAPMGNITVRNLRIASGTTGARAIFMLGGLNGISIDNVSIDGHKQLAAGIYYEFGWATNEVQEYRRQTSHATNIRITNLTVANVVNEAFGANGAFDTLIDNMRVTDAAYACVIGTGESLYFRPWVPSGDHAKRPRFAAHNVTGESLRSLGIEVRGANGIAASYLNNPPANDNPNRIGPDQESDLIDFVLDQFTLSGTSNNYGIHTSAASAQISNGTLTGFQRGIVTTQECTHFAIDAVTIFDSSSFGIQIGQGSSMHASPRLATGTVHNCVIAGSGTGGKCAGIIVSTTRSCVIDGCRFGYSTATDGKSEVTQTQAVTVGADASGVICRGNNVSGTADGATAYVLVGGAGRNCRIESPSGIQTKSGAW